MTDRDFSQLQRQLEEVMSKLKGSNEPKLRRDLLAEMRRLLAEAERVAHSPPNSSFGPP
jgi:hypothetical protein